MPDWHGSYSKFRLNFEQLGKRAKELLKAARAGDPEVLARFKSPPRLAEAQFLVAKELRFENWAAGINQAVGANRAAGCYGAAGANGITHSATPPPVKAVRRAMQDRLRRAGRRR